MQRLGIDVGGTNLRLGVVSTQKSPPVVVHETRFEANFSALCHASANNQAASWQAILETMASAIQPVIQQFPDIQAIGIGFPGFINPATQQIWQSPNLPGLANVNLSQDLKPLVHLPVLVENDALAAAYGEFISLAKQESLLYVGLGTGVGGGLVLAGAPYAGQRGVAMEIGHLIVKPNGRACGCGNLGCMEQYASTRGVSKTYLEATGQSLSANEIAQLANAGNNAAKLAFALAGETLAQALAHVLKTVDIADIVIGGGMRQSWSLLAAAFTQQLEADLIPALRGKTSIHLANPNDQAGMLGAAMLAARSLTR